MNNKCDFIVNETFHISFQALTITDVSTGLVTQLNRNSVEFLILLSENPSKIFTKEELMHKIWLSKGVIVEESSLMHAVSQCRKAFGTSGNKVIKTYRGKGYCFDGEIKIVDSVDGKRTKESTRNINEYSCVFVVVFLVFFFISGYLNFSAETEDIEVESHNFEKCTLILPSKKRVVLEPASHYTFNGISIIYDNESSISFSESMIEVDCE